VTTDTTKRPDFAELMPRLERRHTGVCGDGERIISGWISHDRADALEALRYLLDEEQQRVDDRRAFYEEGYSDGHADGDAGIDVDPCHWWPLAESKKRATARKP